MNKQYEIETFLREAEKGYMLDIRTPAEYEKGHISTAINFPLFTNEERSEVGTIYKQIGPEQALLKGLERVGPNLSTFVEEASVFLEKSPLALYCWRGGKRSASMAWLLSFAGHEVITLKDGYKAFRTFVLDYLSNVSANLIVVGGRTGSGKTKVLHELHKKGEQIIDLEALANHKGSAFGGLGETPQPSNEHFENILFHELRKLDLRKQIWIENESQSIGTNYIVKGFWDLMKASPLINIEISEEARLKNILDLYASFEKADLIQCFHKIKKKLGGQHVKKAIESLENHDYISAVQIALKYYDKTYDHGLQKNPSPDIEVVNFGNDSSESIANQLIELADNKFI